MVVQLPRVHVRECLKGHAIPLLLGRNITLRGERG